MYQNVLYKNISSTLKTKILFLLVFTTTQYRLRKSKIKTNLRNAINFLIYFIEITRLLDIINFVRLFILLRRTKPTILHINNGGYPGAKNCRIMVFSAKYAGIKKIVFGVHNLATEQKGYIDKVIDRFINKNVNYLLTASKEARLKLIENRKFNADKVKQIYNAIKQPKVVKRREDLLKDFHIQDDRFIIVEVALLTKRKGQIYLLKALNTIRQNDNEIFKKILVFFIGDGDERPNLENYMIANNLENNIKFLGYRPDYMDFINAADIFVLPSIQSEDMPLVILSAMSLKKAIISTRLAGIVEEIHHDKEGILLDIIEIDKLSEAIITLYNDEELRKKLGNNAFRRYVDVFNYDIIISKYIELYEKLLGENAS